VIASATRVLAGAIGDVAAATAHPVALADDRARLAARLERASEFIARPSDATA